MINLKPIMGAFFATRRRLLLVLPASPFDRSLWWPIFWPAAKRAAEGGSHTYTWLAMLVRSSDDEAAGRRRVLHRSIITNADDGIISVASLPITTGAAQQEGSHRQGRMSRSSAAPPEAGAPGAQEKEQGKGMDDASSGSSRSASTSGSSTAAALAAPAKSSRGGGGSGGSSLAAPAKKSGGSGGGSASDDYPYWPPPPAVPLPPGACPACGNLKPADPLPECKKCLAANLCGTFFCVCVGSFFLVLRRTGSLGPPLNSIDFLGVLCDIYKRSEPPADPFHIHVHVHTDGPPGEACRRLHENAKPSVFEGCTARAQRYVNTYISNHHHHQRHYTCPLTTPTGQNPNPTPPPFPFTPRCTTHSLTRPSIHPPPPTLTPRCTTRPFIHPPTTPHLDTAPHHPFAHPSTHLPPSHRAAARRRSFGSSSSRSWPAIATPRPPAPSGSSWVR